MKNPILLFLIAIFLCCFTSNREGMLPPPPETPKKEITETYFGYEVEDPYHFLEKNNNIRVKRWYKKQADYTENILSNITGREEMRNYLTDYLKPFQHQNTIPHCSKNKLYSVRTDVLEGTMILLYRDNPDTEPVQLFSTKEHKEKTGVSYKITDHRSSHDDKYIAITLQPESGPNELYIMEVSTREKLDDKLQNFLGVSWSYDNKGFFYTQRNSSAGSKGGEFVAKWHLLRSDAQNDIKIISASNNPELQLKPGDMPFVGLNPELNILEAYVMCGATYKKKLFFIGSYSGEIGKDIHWKCVLAEKDSILQIIPFEKSLIVKTSANTPNYRIVRYYGPEYSKSDEILIENDLYVQTLQRTGEAVYVKYNKGCIDLLSRIDVETGKNKMIDLPFHATISFTGKEDFIPNDYRGLFCTLESWNKPPAIYHYNPKDNQIVKTTLLPEPEIEGLDNIVTEQIMVKSHDGLEIPLSIVYNKEMFERGSNPLIIEAYGAYGNAFSPFYEPAYIAWIQKGGIYAFAHVRGGGEFGEIWHKAGMKENKPNTWKDYIACAEYLLQHNYTSKEKLLAFGISAGGITVGRAMTENPNLFKAVVTMVGGMHTIIAGYDIPAYIEEYGTIKDSTGFLGLLEMDSYLHIQDNVKYPATLLTVGMQDKWVHPCQPGKFVARLQAVNSNNAPTLLWIDYNAGHFSGSANHHKDFTDIFTFYLWQTGHPDFKYQP